MTNLIAIRNGSRTPLRVGTTNVPTTGASVNVDLDDAAVRRSLNAHLGRWLPAQTGAGDAANAVLAAPTAEAAEARTVSIQLNNHAGAALAARAVVEAFVSTDATGDAPGDGALTIALTAGTDGAILPGATASARAVFVSEADGDLDIVLTDSAAGTGNVYLHVVLPTGRVVSSAVIAFAA